MLKVGILGIGGISGAHIPVLLGMEDVKVVSMCDIRPEMAKKYEGKTDAVFYTDADKMLENEELDILDICLPTFLHIEYSMKAIERGINVICEKPASLDPKEITMVYEAARQRGVRYMTAQVLRFWQEYKQLKELVDTGKYGKVLSGNMFRLGSYPKWSWDNWYTDESRSGLVPFDLHVHDADFLVYAFGEPLSVTSKRQRTPGQDYLCATYDYGDFFVRAEAAWYGAPYQFSAGFRFQFEQAVVAYENGKMKIYESTGNVIDMSAPVGEGGNVINLPHTNAYAEEIYYFTDCVKSGKEITVVEPHSLETICKILNKLK